MDPRYHTLVDLVLLFRKACKVLGNIDTLEMSHIQLLNWIGPLMRKVRGVPKMILYIYLSRKSAVVWNLIIYI